MTSLKNLTFRPMDNKVLLEGTATPGAVIKAENLSAAPFHGGWQKDNYSTTTADAQGHFSLPVTGGVDGDKVRVSQAGAAAQVVTVGVPSPDSRRVDLNLQPLRLLDQGNGTFALSTVSVQARVGEPGGVLQFTNTRTQQSQQVTLGANGWFPPDFRLAGQPGDVVKVAATDGVNNADFANPWGSLVMPPRRDAVSIRTPFEPPIQQEYASMLTMTRINGPLFVDGPAAADACQGDLGDCYLVSSAAAIAQSRPQLLERMIKDNQDGTFTVHFKRYDRKTSSYRDEPITVTNTFPALGGQPFNAATQPLPVRFPMQNGRPTPSKPPEKTELWFLVLEKAYAAWKGGYDGVANGYPYEVFEACLGAPGKHFDVRSDDPKAIQAALLEAAHSQQPVVCWSGVEGTGRGFTNSGLVPDHAYTVLGTEEKNGELQVKLRNPWGWNEPPGHGADDGVFTLPWSTFARFFDGVGVAK
jgi:hypothetical protein